MAKIACAQSDVAYADPMANVATARAVVAAQPADLMLFPEAFLTGYAVDSADEAARIAIPADHAAMHALQQLADESGTILVVGFIERDAHALFNSATVFQPGQEQFIYRKTHLPFLGVDRFVEAGESLPVIETAIGRIGVLVCFDLRFPEAARTLALRGAELIVLPTNWPEGAEVSADHISIARAAESRVFLATCNRVGTENGFGFIGRSKIIDIDGRVLASAGSSRETIAAEIDLAQARDKHRVVIPGAYETNVFARRPELYADSGS